VKSKKWIYPIPVAEDALKEFTEELNVLPVTAAVLHQRGLRGDAAKQFIRPAGLRLCDFRDLPGTQTAGSRIAHAIRNGEKIAVFGDYDVDGITSSALMGEFIRSRGGECKIFLPNRLEDGYGLNRRAIEQAAENGVRLLITVDCGITGYEEVAMARRMDIDTIITDHHEPPEKLPDANVIVNPKLDGPEELTVLAGVGVTLQVVRATAHALGEKDPEQLRRHLDLVALGTVADVVPLFGENRSLTRAGLAVINRGTRLGLQALLRVSGLESGAIRSQDLAFRVAPRINAVGRLGDAQVALDLLMAEDANEADRLARILNEQNTKRQGIEKQVLHEAEAKLQAMTAVPEVIVLSDARWPIGVVGLAASRLSERYYRPCFVLSEQNGFAKGSGRSIAGFSLYAALDAVSPILEKWGGHEMAAGVTLAKEKLPEFFDKLQRLASEQLSEDAKEQVLYIDAVLPLAEIDDRLLNEFGKLEPFGYKNTRPLLVLENCRICLPPRVVGERHLKMKITDDQNNFLDVIGFGLGERVQEININNFIDIAGHASENVWNNTRILQIEMKDFQKTDTIAIIRESH